MKIYLKSSYILFVVLLSSLTIEASSSNSPIEQSNTSKPGALSNQQLDITTEPTSQKNLFMCVFCCYYATCSCCCPEFCDENVVPCLKKISCCCKTKEME